MSLEQPIMQSPTTSVAASSAGATRIVPSPSPLPIQPAATYSIMVSPSLSARSNASRASSTTSSSSSSNPLLHSTQSLNAIPTFVPSVSLDAQSSADDSQLPSPLISVPDGAGPDLQMQSPNDTEDDVDLQILEALKSKDRLYVLKLGEVMEGIINDRTKMGRADLTPATSYQRLLVHRCSSYYKLSPESDTTSKAIIVSITAESRIPSRRLCELVPVEFTAQPTFKIMRRSAPNRTKSQSQAGSVAGEDADLSDVEASETGSMGGRSNATGGSNKKRMTIEEREAAYNEARSRIFMDFEDKEKDKDSASSSTLSLVSGSSSASAAGGGSSIGDFDDFVSTETESEWSAPVTRERKDGKRGGANSSVSSSSRSLRPSAPSFSANGSGSSRGSRAPSPSFTYASLYEPAPTAPYDGTQQAAQPQQMMPPYPAPYVYPYGQPPPNFLPSGGYPYYPPYPYPQMPPPPGEGPSPGSAEMYSPPPQVPYGQPYGWQQSTSAQAPPQYPPPFVPGQQYPYPMHGYYPGPLPHPAPPMAPPLYSPDRDNRNGFNSNGSGSPSRASSRNSAGSNGSKHRGPPSHVRAPWTPGAPMGGYSFNGPFTGETVGPRLSSNSRRTSGHSSGSSNYNKSSPGDEASSTASSSTTSSSSRRTYTSNTSSQHHPLPARPDWAVNLPLNPRHAPMSSHPMGISPSQSVNGSGNMQRQPQRHLPPPALQSTDFPPLAGVAAAPEKRVPAGAWTNSSRSILMPNQGQGQVHPPGSALVHHHPNQMNNNNNNHFVGGPQNHGGMSMNDHLNMRHDDTDRTFERPPPKPAAELFNPKVVRRIGANNANNAAKSSEDRDKERMRGETVASAILVSQFGSISLDVPSVGKVEGVPKEFQNGTGVLLETAAT